MPTKKPNIDHALSLAAAGLPVFPCHPKTKAALPPRDKDEHGLPVLRSGGHLKRTTDETEIRQRWTKRPDALIGYVPGDLKCLAFDIDKKGAETGALIVGLLGQPRCKYRSSKPDRFHLLYPEPEGKPLKNLDWEHGPGGGQIRHRNGYLVAWNPPALLTAIQAAPGEPPPRALIDYILAEEPGPIDYAAAQMRKTTEERNNALNALTYQALKNAADPVVLIPVMRQAALAVGLEPHEIEGTLESARASVQSDHDENVDRIKPVLPLNEEGLAEALDSLAWEMRFNTRQNAEQYRRAGNWQNANDRLCAKLRAEIRKTCVTPKSATQNKPMLFTRDKWSEATDALAYDREVDPFLDWLDSLPDWDGEQRLSWLLERTLGAEASQLADHASRSILLAAVWRAYKPGTKHDEMVVLVGPQGIGKSLFCRHLLPPERQDEWFGDSIDLTAQPKDRIEHTLGRVIVEASELIGMRRAEVERLKAYMSAQADICRLAYRKHTDTLPRRFVLIGTANDSGAGVLPNDPTGLRRFVPIAVSGHPDGVSAMLAELEGEREQFWAEALYAYRENRETAYMRGGTIRQAAEAAEKYRSKNALIEERMEIALQDKNEYSLSELLGYLSADHRQEKIVTAILKNANWTKRRMRRDGKQVTLWCAPCTDPDR